MEKDPEADRAFAKLASKFVILHFDTANGRAPHVGLLKVKRNQTYALVLRPDGTEIDRIEKPSRAQADGDANEKSTEGKTAAR